MNDYISRLPTELLYKICNHLTAIDLHSLMSAVPETTAQRIQSFKCVEFDYNLLLCVSDCDVNSWNFAQILDALVNWYKDERKQFLLQKPNIINLSLVSHPTLPLIVLFELCQVFHKNCPDPYSIMPDAVNYVNRQYIQKRPWQWLDQQELCQKTKVMCLFFGINKLLLQKKRNTHELAKTLPHLISIQKSDIFMNNAKIYDKILKTFIINEMAREMKCHLMRKLYNSEPLSKWNINVNWADLISAIAAIPPGQEHVYTTHTLESMEHIIDLHSSPFMRNVLLDAVKRNQSGNATIIALTIVLFIYEDDNLENSFNRQKLFPQNLYPKHNISNIFNVVTNFIDNLLFCYYEHVLEKFQ